MTLKEVIAKLKEIKSKGCIPSLRSGPTGVGYTFEHYFGVKENNIPIPDIGGTVEIKTTRRDSQSLITLFTFNKGVWEVNPRDLILKYGYVDNKGRHALKTTVFYGKPNALGLYLQVDEEQNLIKLVESKGNSTLGVWDLFVIVGKFMTKFGKLLFVIADSGHTPEGRECFRYSEAYLLSEPDSRKFMQAFKDSLIGLDLRMHLKETGTVRNRGTAFRIREANLMDLYAKKQKLI